MPQVDEFAAAAEHYRYRPAYPGAPFEPSQNVIRRSRFKSYDERATDALFQDVLETTVVIAFKD